MPEPFQPRTFRFACDVVRLYVALIQRTSTPPQIARQLLRAGTSIGANLEEAKGAQSRRDATARFSIALKEARETQYWLRLLEATNLAPEVSLAALSQEASELVAILTTARKRMNAAQAEGRLGHKPGFHG